MVFATVFPLTTFVYILYNVAAEDHLIPYQLFFPSPTTTTDAVGPLRPYYLIRQSLPLSLPSRMQKRPPLENGHKRYITYQVSNTQHTQRQTYTTTTPPPNTHLTPHPHTQQLLLLLSRLDGLSLTHLDIHPTNVYVTSFLYVLLTDFGGFKPRSLDRNDPTAYNYFYARQDSLGCCVAPERFGSGSPPPPSPSPAGRHAHDVFSLGCVLLTAWLNGEDAFTLPSLLRYKDGDVDEISRKLDKVEDSAVRKVIKHMLGGDRDRGGRYLKAVEEAWGEEYEAYRRLEEMATKWRRDEVSPDGR